MRLLSHFFRLMSQICWELATMVISLLVGLFGGTITALTQLASDQHQEHKRKKGERPGHLHRPGRDDTL